MQTFLKNKFVTASIVIATLILAGVAIFTAVRLYQLRQKPVAPTVPESKPLAAGKACSAISFNLATPTPTGTASPSPSPSGSPTATPSPSPTSSPTATPTPSQSATPTSPPITQASPTQEPSLPEAGTTWPTVVAFGVALLVIIGSVLIAL